MDYKEMVNSITKNEIKNVYLFYGEENYLIDDVLQRLKVKLIDPNFEQLNFVNIDGKETGYNKIIDICETLPFMSEKRLVYINALPIFKEDSKPSKEGTGEEDKKEGEEEKLFIEYISKVPESTVIVFYGNQSVDARKKIVKEIKKFGSLVEFTKLKELELNEWIKSKLKSLGKTIGLKELALFKNNLDYLGRNSIQQLLDVENEIKKLASFMGETTNVESEHIKKGMESGFHNDIFNLMDAIGKQNFAESIERLNILLDDGEPIFKILATVGNQVKNILGAKLLTEEKVYSDKDIGAKLKIHPFVASKSIAQSRQFTVDRLKNILNLFLEADLALKSTVYGKMEERLVMEMLIFKMCQK